MLWTLRYKRPPAGVTTGLIEARDDFEVAQRVGQRWCDEQPGVRYISVERAVLATEAILGTALEPDATPPPPPKPTLAEQRERLAQRAEEAAVTGNIAPALRPELDEMATASPPESKRGRPGRVGQ